MEQSQDNRDVMQLSYEQLQAEYERSQWTLAMLVRKMGGIVEIADSELEEAPRFYRLWYTRHSNRRSYVIELKEEDSKNETN